MSNSNRGSITLTWIAFSALIVVVASWLIWNELKHAAPQAVSNEYETSRYAERAQNRIDRICVGLSGVDLIHCEYEIEQPERESHRAQKDLRAQRYMAIWAFFMMAFTFGTLIVTGFGVYFVRQTLIQTNDTNKAAIAAAGEANESNRIMRSEQRPWLKLTAKPVKIQKSGGNIEVTCEVIITNVGRTPALGVFLGATATAVPTFHENEMSARSFASDVRSSADHMHQIIFPDDSLTMNYTTRVRTEALDQREEMLLREISKGLKPEISFAVAYGSATGGNEFHSVFSLIVLNQDGRAFHISEGESFDDLKFIQSRNFKAT